VIRGGGMFWDSEPLWHHFRAGASLGPLGNGRQTLPATALTNIFPNIVNLSNGQPLSIGASLPLNTLTNMTLGQFVQIYNQEIPQLTQLFAPAPPAGCSAYRGSMWPKAPSKLPPPTSKSCVGIRLRSASSAIWGMTWFLRSIGRGGNLKTSIWVSWI